MLEKAKSVTLEKIIELMKSHGANNFIFKPLANNDNSKQQVYLGSDFSVVQGIPSGDVFSGGIGSKGAIFKAPLNFFWLSPSGESERAPGAQLILYPQYPEVRLSGVLRECSIAPSHLMKPPTKKEREARESQNRYLIIGIKDESVYCYLSSWGDQVSKECEALIESNESLPVFTVFHEYRLDSESSRSKLIKKLHDIYSMGKIQSCRLNSKGEILDYNAQNGAGYTLEAQFGITPNGHSDPDFMDWELKAHSSGAVTLMTPEPDMGTYRDNLEAFLKSYATRKQPERMDFASIHRAGLCNSKTGLTLGVEGFDSSKKKIVDPDGGLMVRNKSGELAAGWSFSKLIDHWKKKHSNTCFVSYVKTQSEKIFYTYGPDISLATGTDLNKYISALSNSTIYYDPGIKMAKENGRWKSKKRNQFRVAWGDVSKLYIDIETVDLSVL